MIELVVLNFLANNLTVPVKTEKTAVPEGKMVFIERTGGSGKFLKESTFAIQSYAESQYEAAALNDQVIEAMNGIDALDEIVSVDLNATYNFTDTVTKKYRYQAVFDIKHY